MKSRRNSQPGPPAMLRRSALFLAALVVSAVTAWAQETAPAEPEKTESPPAEQVEAQPGEYNNWVEVSAGTFFTHGDPAQFQRRHGMRDNSFGGVEDFHWEMPVQTNGLFSIDGRGIFDNDDYSITLSLSHPDIGYVRGGYREFRTWYDGSGGFSPLSNAWVNVDDQDELFLDRREVWFEGGLTLPDWPVMTVRYSFEQREGMKDSTIWGDYSVSGNNSNIRNIVPTFRDIDENRHIVDAELTHTIGKTSFGVGFRYEHDDQENSLNIARRPGDPTRSRTVTQRDEVDSDIYGAHAFVERRLHAKVLFTMGGSYTHLDTDIGGSRIYGPTYGSPFSPISIHQQSNDEGFLDLSGGSQVDQYVANLNLMITPWQNVAIVPALRIEYQDQDGEAMFTETRVTNTATAASLTDVLNSRIRRFTDVTESLEGRYTGFTNWSLYARGEWLQGQGSLKESEFDVEDEGVGPVQLQRDTDSERFVQKYTAGANWYAHRKVNFGGQYYYRARINDYDHNVDSSFFNPPSTNNLYPAFIRKHEFDTHDVNFRMTLRPLVNLTLVSRYDFQFTTYKMQGAVNTFGIPLDLIESAEATSHIFSQSVSWSPLPRLYAQGSISYAIQHTDTPAADLKGGAASLVQDSENDYWNASTTIGYALSPQADLQARYFYYRADNYDTGEKNLTLPYGASAEQHGLTLTLRQQLLKNVIWKIQYGFFTGHDQTSGGHNDYTAHLAYTSWQYLF